jgi:glutamine amidotransferase
MEHVAVIDYGMGNLRSVAKALELVGENDFEVTVTSDRQVVDAADRVVFPGQGAIRDCMAELEAHQLIPAVLEAIASKPFLGICIGLQALMQKSEEHASTPGLGVLEGEVERFPADSIDPHTGERHKVPHMGWNQVNPTRPHPLWSGVTPGERFYFVHSYYVTPLDAGVTAATTPYAVEFVSAIARGNLFAVQFHPEKSQRPGLRLLHNFLHWKPT